MKLAALFSGQGAQYPGMGKELWERFPQVKELYACAGDIFGFDVAKTSFEGTEEELARTLTAQPVIFVHSLAAFTAAKETLPAPAAVAGHSLGEFAALCCAGAYSPEDGMRIIKARAKAMEDAAKTASGAMYAVMGGEVADVEAACKQTGGQVAPVNFNLPSQTVISGEEAAAANAASILEGQGKKVKRLSVSSAFHTALMQPAADALAAAIRDIAFRPIQMDFYSNLTGGKLLVEDYPDYFARHMVSPVRFVEQATAMAGDGITACVEYGPKKTVSTLAKKNVRAFTVCNVEDLKTLQKAGEALGV